MFILLLCHRLGFYFELLMTRMFPVHDLAETEMESDIRNIIFRNQLLNCLMLDHLRSIEHYEIHAAIIDCIIYKKGPFGSLRRVTLTRISCTVHFKSNKNTFL